MRLTINRKKRSDLNAQFRDKVRQRGWERADSRRLRLCNYNYERARGRGLIDKRGVDPSRIGWK